MRSRSLFPLFFFSVLMAQSSLDDLYPFDVVEPTGLPYHIIVSGLTVNGENPSSGTEIGIFDGTTCVGAGNYDPSSSIVTWEGSQDPLLSGFTSGNLIRVLVRTNTYNTWDVYESTISVVTGDGNYGTGSYAVLELAVADDALPNITASAAAMNFGTLPVGASSQDSVVISNTGLALLNISTINTTDYQFSHDGETGFLGAGESDTIRVTYVANAADQATGSLRIYSDDPDTPLLEIDLLGQGLPIPQAELTLSTTSLDFGSVSVGASATEQLQLFNSGSEELNVSGVALTDRTGYALNFDGSDDYVDIGSPDLGIDTTATFSAWIYPRNGSGVIAMQGFRHQGNEYGWVVAIGWDSWSGSETSDRELVWASHDNSSNANNSMTAASPALITLNQWQHIAVTKNATEIKMYINGILIHTEQIAATTITYNSGNNLRLGKKTESAYNFYHLQFDGRMSDVRLYDVVLTAEEIGDNMYEAPSENEEGLVGYWGLDDGSGTTVSDASASGNDGTIYNADWYDGGEITTFTTQLAPFVVAPGGAYGLNIAFTPASSGSFADALILTSNAGNTLTASSINLSGSGMDGYFTPVMPTGLPYNILINDITIDGNALTPGDEIGVFEYDANTENDLCVGSFIYTGENEDIFQIIAWEADPELGLSGFTSGSDIIIKCWATTYDSTLELYPIATWVEGNGAFGEGEFSVVSLNVESGIEPAISTNQTSVLFPDTHIGEEATQSIQVYNTGQRDLTINSINSNNGSFYASPTNFIIFPGDTQNVNIVFNPQTPLPISGELTIYSDDPNDPETTISVQGQGLQSNNGEIQAPVGLIEFPSTAIGDTSTVMVPLFNSGGGTITVTDIQTSNPSFFSSWGSFYIQSGQTVNMPLSFTPGDSVSMYNASIILYNSSGNKPVLSIQASAFGYGGFFNVVESTGLPYTIVIDSLIAPEDSVYLGDEIGIFDGSTPVGVVVAGQQTANASGIQHSLSFDGSNDLVNIPHSSNQIGMNQLTLEELS